MKRRKRVGKPPVVTGSGNVIGHVVIDGQPYINGKKAIYDKKISKELLLDGAFSRWKCPECDAHLSGKDMICLNTCHLSAASASRFRALMGAAASDVRRRERIRADVESGKMSVVDALAQAEHDSLGPMMKSMFKRKSKGSVDDALSAG